jgi:hypothetical protein
MDLNDRHVPHFALSGASRFTDPARFPWTMGTIASYETEGQLYTKYILQNIHKDQHQPDRLSRLQSDAACEI